MKKILILLTTLLILLVGCNKKTTSFTTTTVASTTTTIEETTLKEAFDITPYIGIPDDIEDYKQLSQAITKKGTIEDYRYIYNGSIKSAKVYLPYYYDDLEKIDTLYLLHPFGGSETSYIDTIDIASLMDFLIYNGEIGPLIVVMPTWNNGAYVQENDIYTKFPDELAYIVSDFDSRYKTNSDRAHRICGGFSMGGITTWSVFAHHLDLFETYINMSGYMWEVSRLMDDEAEAQNLKFLEEQINVSSNKKFTMYNYTGTSDFVHDYLLALLSKCGESEFFDFGNNVAIEVLEGAEHKTEYSGRYLADALKTIYSK